MNYFLIALVIIGFSNVFCQREGAKMRSMSTDPSPFTVKVLIVSDNELLTKFYGGSRTKLLKDNAVSSKQLKKLYADVNIKVEFVTPIICAKEECPLPPTSDDPMEYLTSIADFTSKSYAKTQKYDVIIHLTGYFYNFENVVNYALGCGFIGGVCTQMAKSENHLNVAFVKASDTRGKFSPTSIGSMMAHEMGHLLGLDHDDQNATKVREDCSCPDDETGRSCVMYWANTGVPQDRWSSCSRKWLTELSASPSMATRCEKVFKLILKNQGIAWKEPSMWGLYLGCAAVVVIASAILGFLYWRAARQKRLRAEASVVMQVRGD